MLQHSANISSETERKDEYMARHGGTESWLFLSYISCGQVLDRHRLHDLEHNIIGLYPNSLNRMRHPSSLYKAVPREKHAHVIVDLANDVCDARRIKPGNCRVEVRLQITDADGAVLSGVNLNEAIGMYTTVSWHSSYP